MCHADMQSPNLVESSGNEKGDGNNTPPNRKRERVLPMGAWKISNPLIKASIPLTNKAGP